VFGFAGEHTAPMADWDGALYEQVNALQRWVADRSLADVFFRGDEQVLDIGCGDGAITARLAEQLASGEISGIDVSPRMISAARDRHPGLTFEVGDVLTMRYDSAFDVATSFNVLHWVLDLREAFARIRAALRPSGWALVQFVCGSPRPSLEATAMNVARQPEWAASFGGFEAPFAHPNPDDATRLVRAVGLDVISSTVDDLRWDFRSGADFERWAGAGFGDWAARVPGRDAAFVADVVARYSEITGSDRTLLFTQLRIRMRRPEA
jgi:trans-aconitate 2-methyltransferase